MKTTRMNGQRMTGLRGEARQLRLAHAYGGVACYGSLVAAEKLEARATMLEQAQDDESAPSYELPPELRPNAG